MARLAGIFRMVLFVLLAAAAPALANSNKLANPFFTSNLDGWDLTNDSGFEIGHSWHVGHVAPGAMVVTLNGTKAVDYVFAYQKVNVKAGTVYSAGTWFYFPAQVQTVPRGYVTAHYFSGPDCTGALLTSDSSALSPTAPGGTWLLVQKAFTPPPDAKSARFYVGVKTTEAKPSLAVFDEVFLSGGYIGDVDANGSIAVADVFYLINHLFAGGPLPIGPADVNQDYVVNVGDAFYLINYLFAGGPLPVE